jgi:hypothetical protein
MGQAAGLGSHETVQTPLALVKSRATGTIKRFICL